MCTFVGEGSIEPVGALPRRFSESTASKDAERIAKVNHHLIVLELALLMKGGLLLVI
jgi:hypothetical protein